MKEYEVWLEVLALDVERGEDEQIVFAFCSVPPLTSRSAATSLAEIIRARHPTGIVTAVREVDGEGGSREIERRGSHFRATPPP